MDHQMAPAQEVGPRMRELDLESPPASHSGAGRHRAGTLARRRSTTRVSGWQNVWRAGRSRAGRPDARSVTAWRSARYPASGRSTRHASWRRAIPGALRRQSCGRLRACPRRRFLEAGQSADVERRPSRNCRPRAVPGYKKRRSGEEESSVCGGERRGNAVAVVRLRTTGERRRPYRRSNSPPLPASFGCTNPSEESSATATRTSKSLSDVSSPRAALPKIHAPRT